MEKINKIARLIGEDPDIHPENEPEEEPEGPEGDFDTCPACGNDYATITNGQIVCPEASCEYYNEEYVDMLPAIVGGPPAVAKRFSKKNIELTKRYKYIGKKGIVVMWPIAVRATLPNPGSYEGYADPDAADYYGADKLNKETVIEFDDAIDRGHYFVLFVRRKRPLVKVGVSRTPKYTGKYVFADWEWPDADCGVAAGEPGARGIATVTRTHDTIPCAKDCIKKMEIGGKTVIDREA